MKTALCLGCFLLLCCQLGLADNGTKPLAKGLSYRALPLPSISAHSKLHTFTIDLKYFKLRSVLASSYELPSAFVRDLAKRDRAHLAVNGGYFTPEQTPLGLRVNHGKVYNPVRNVSWWHVFSVEHERASILPRYRFSLSPTIDFAIQSGPRLLRDGQIPKLKPGFAERSALALDKQGHVILAVTENAPMQTTDLAKLLRDELHCQQALSLDGGNSTQLYAQFTDLHLDVSNLSAVTDAVVVIPN